MQEKSAKYKWYVGQYTSLMAQYSSGIVGTITKPPKQKEEARARKPRRQEEEREE